MLLLIGLGAGLLAGLVTGGHLANVGLVRWRWTGLVLLALAVRQVGLEVDVGKGQIFAAVFVLATALLLGWAAWHARLLPGLWLLALGLGLNLLVILANGGHMPFAPPDSSWGGTAGQYVVEGPGSRLLFLADWVRLPGLAGTALDSLYSPGDVVMLVGLAVAGFQASKYRAFSGSSPKPARIGV